MGLEHKLSEQVYLAFHDWRARMDKELDRLDTDYLRALRIDMQRTVDRIEHEITSRSAGQHTAEDAGLANHHQG